MPLPEIIAAEEKRPETVMIPVKLPEGAVTCPKQAKLLNIAVPGD